MPTLVLALSTSICVRHRCGEVQRTTGIQRTMTEEAQIKVYWDSRPTLSEKEWAHFHS